MSQIIPLGIGSPAEIPQFVLFGLSPAALPPPPSPGSGGEFKIISPGVAAYSFNEFSSLIFTDGSEFTLPPYPVEITWHTIYGSAPALAHIVLQASLDGSNWATIDTSTATSGEIRTVQISAQFIRAAMLDVTEGIITTVLINLKRISDNWF